MCGIAGTYRVRGDVDDSAIVRRMLTRLVRRGPDSEGLAVERRAVLGHRRLAILDPSDAGHQPMVSADGRFVVILNGEIYNFRDLARELGLGPETLRSRTDTEVLLHAWMRWGSGALERMVGQWAFAVYDRTTESLTLARDRFGEKPLFYARGADRVTFASSPEALLEDPALPRRLDPRALAEYVTLRYVVSPRTVLDSVSKLEGGHLLEMTPDQAMVERVWYRQPFRSHSDPRPRTRTERFGELLERSSARCLTSDRPVGLLLSDGIDSNALLAAMPDTQSNVTCFTFRLRGGDRSEIPAAIEPQGHELVSVEASRDELARHFDEFCTDLTEPVGDVAALATWKLIRSARSRATVFLCGHGGDEVLGGYRLSQNLFRLELLRRSAVLPASWMRGAMRRHLHGAESLECLRERLRAAAPAQAPAAARFLIDRPLPASEVRDLTGGSPANGEGYLATIDRLYDECDTSTPALGRVQDVLARTFLSANILSWADSVAMSSSAELRMPYLDRDLVEFVAGLPAGHRVPPWPGKSNTKRVLRDWARSRLPAGVLGRSKKGFQSGSARALLPAIPGTARTRVLGSAPLRRALPGLEAWVGSIAEDGSGGAAPLMWALLVLATWCDAHNIA
jgi:asparagine synthase (glutamine-hydrolysing)